MHVFESILLLLLGGTVLSLLAQRVRVPYPTLLAVGGAILAFVPGAPALQLPPELILALFVAPVLMDAAYDASLRDLRRRWIPVSSLVLVAVAVTTVAVAVVTRWLMPDTPWGAAIALGALVAPPDAVAALAVLRQVDPPYSTRIVLEGESLLNDASALLIYRLAVAATAGASFTLAGALPDFLLVVVGSVAAGWLLAWPVGWLMARLPDAASSVVFQFLGTFTVWLAADRLGLSGVVTIVVFAITLAQQPRFRMPARLRVPSFAIWGTVTTVLNVLAFILIGSQLGPILARLGTAERLHYAVAGLIILATVIVVRLAWMLTYHGLVLLTRRLVRRGDGAAPAPTAKDALVVGWCGMRGIVTLAAALALPGDFPARDFIQFAAFMVVLGTLVLQGITLEPLLRVLRLPRDHLVERELTLARKAALKAALAFLDGRDGAAAERLRAEYSAALSGIVKDGATGETTDDRLRRKIVAVARDALDELRNTQKIGDEAYRRVEEELDWLELSATPASAE